MRSLLILLLALTVARAAEPPFEILPGDRVLLLGDTLLEREGTYGYLETRMHEQFADRPFTVRNLSFAGDTPLGVSRAAFDPPAKGWERLIEQIALVKPTVVFLGYGMAASLQELTDRSQDPTLNRDTARYGEEPMTAARFKKELGTLMDAIVQKAGVATAPVPGGALDPSAAAGVSPGAPGSASPAKPAPTGVPGGSPGTALGSSAPPSAGVRFVLLSPIRHEDLRATRPGLPDPAEHNKLLAEYSKAIEELAQEHGARFVPSLDLSKGIGIDGPMSDNGIHLNRNGYRKWATEIGLPLWGTGPHIPQEGLEMEKALQHYEALRAAIVAKNALFFHRWRPANSTYLTGFRQHEQGQNAREMPMFDPLIEKAEAEIERLKRGGAAPDGKTAPTTEKVSPSGEKLPATGAKLPATTEKLSAAGARLPATTEKLPDTGEKLSATAERLSATGEKLPATTERLATTSDKLPTTNEKGRTPSPSVGTLAPSVPTPLPTFTVEDGYQIELWAENPLLEKPTEMNWDALGRLWVCSSSLYPMIEPGQVADDKVLVLSDPGKTGKATKSEVFAKGLLVPTGVVPDLMGANATDATNAGPSRPIGPIPPIPTAAYGCYVGQSTELLHFAPDGTRRIVLSGFGTEDTHHIVHTLRWGPDGRLYFNQSIYIHSHLETPWGLVRLNSGGCLAYDPRTERTEVFAKGWINSWGHAWDRWGQSFFTDGAGGGGVNWAFPGAQFVTYEGARQTVPSVSPGSYPKFAGLELIYSPHFPADWQGNAVTCDFRAHRIVRFSIEDLAAPMTPIRPIPPIGQTGAREPMPSSGYTTKEMPDLVRTADLSFRPIDVKLGPDGALYVADWSNPVINHGEVDFRDPRRDHHMGRIWRISKKGEPVVKWEPLMGKKTPELLDGLLSGSLWEKEAARRVLIANGTAQNAHEWGAPAESDKTGIRGALVRWDEKPDPARADALWGIARSIGFDYHHEGPAGRMFQARLIFTLLNDPEPRWRAIGTRNAARWFTEPVYNYDSDCEGVGSGSAMQSDELPRLIADPNPRVRLEAMRALARMRTARSAELVLDAALKAPEGDVFYNHAAWLSINDLAQPWLDALASGAWKAEGRERQLEFALNALPPATARGALAKVLGAGPRDFAKGPWAELIGRAGDPAQLRQLFDALLVSFGMDCCPGDELKNIRAVPIDDATALRCVAALLEAARVRNQRPTGDLLPLERLVFHTNAAVRAGILRLVGYWKPAPGLDWLRGVFKENALDVDCAAATIESVREIGLVKRPGDDLRIGDVMSPAVALLLDHVEKDTPAPTRQRVAVALAALDLKGSFPSIIAAISDAPNEDAALTAWRDLFKISGAIEIVEKKLTEEMLRLKPGTYVPAPGADFTVPRNKDDKSLVLSKTAIAACVRAAREAGKKGEPLLAALTPLAGPQTKPVLGPADFKAIAARMWTQGGDAAQGELIYRRATSGCVTCHAIGGAGGVVGPSLTSLGASAPLDYIIESLLVPNAKVKEGYNGVTLKLKDGSEITGIQARETAQEVILRNVAGQETAVVKANIAGKTDIGSIMPAGLLDALNDNQRMNLYAFLAELGKPGPFDASKANTARVWRLYPGTATDAALKGAPSDASANALTLVDGRLLKDTVKEALQLVTNPGDVIYAVTQFQSTGKTHLDLTGISKAFLDGAPLTITADLAPELPAGLHTLAVKLDIPALPEVLRAASADASFITN